MKAIILRAPGTNCDWETQYALEICKVDAQRIHITTLLENKNILKDFQIFVIPGGFSYGDDISAGKILAVQIQKFLQDQLQEFIEKDKPVIGICNGFQVLLKSKLLGDGITLTYNFNGKFECRWIKLLKEKSNCPFFENIPEIFELPIAHAEGRVVIENDNLLKKIISKKMIAIRYYRFNPNGSIFDIAGICNQKGNLLGLMPHPERFIFETQNPNWQKKRTIPWGRRFFQNLVNYAKNI